MQETGMNLSKKLKKSLTGIYNICYIDLSLRARMLATSLNKKRKRKEMKIWFFLLEFH